MTKDPRVVVSRIYFRADKLEEEGKLEVAEELRKFADELQEYNPK